MSGGGDLVSQMQSLLGRTSPPTTSTIELGAVTRFAEAVGDPIVDDSGTIVIPPTFLCSLPYRRPPMPGGAEDNMVIIDNTATLTRTPVVGEKITAAATFTDIRERGPLIMLTLVCRYKDLNDGEVAVMTCSWMIDTEAEARRPVPIAPRATRELLEWGAPTDQSSVNGHGGPDVRPTRAWDIDVAKLREGDELRPLAKPPLSTLQFVKFAGASHDLNPLHYDSHFASRAGFPDVIAPGMMKWAAFGEHMTLWASRWGRVRSLHARYKGIDLPGAKLTSRGRIKKIETGDDGRRLIAVDLSLDDDTNETHTIGTAEIELSEPSFAYGRRERT